MQRFFPGIVAVLTVVLALLLSSCGQRGPLYLPKQDAPSQPESGNSRQQ